MQRRRRLEGAEVQPVTLRPTVAEHAAWVAAARDEGLSLIAWVVRELGAAVEGGRRSAPARKRRPRAEAEVEVRP
jgi:hypothetical protein